MLIFILKVGSRIQISRKFSSQEEKFIKNINNFLEIKLESKAHHDTLEYFLRGLPVKNLEKLRRKTIQAILRKKSLVNFRLMGQYYLVALDATGSLTFNKPHCKEFLTQKLSNGKILYYHPVLEAKLITKNGFTLSIGSEFIKNEGSKGECDPQDCEIKAAYRLMKKLKKDYPQLRICILGDSLYANQNVFKYCKDFKWKYIITFKEGSIPFIAEEFKLLQKFQPDNIMKTKNQKF